MKTLTQSAINLLLFFNQLVVDLFAIQNCIKLHLLTFYVFALLRFRGGIVNFTLRIERRDMDASAACNS